ncbi:LysM peptidoglycan-binding domain-containing protein [Chloroflexus islandicus]|uniref:LysM peptidoglycan-binding domain-containing protein n=1 Tax=Chloroflexus islandicus TaxID=1707952 RepID=UPI00248127C6|nr:LysM peptidoglycan-binding domain-containing protein [Chloroflexus islandicus]
MTAKVPIKGVIVVRQLWVGIMGALILCASMALTACLPDPPPRNLPTLPAILDITPAPTLDIDATATAYASAPRPTPTVAALYIVQAGDTLSAIAERFSVTVDELVAANNLTDPNFIQPGQTLLIPSLIGTPRPALTPTP